MHWWENAFSSPSSSSRSSNGYHHQHHRKRNVRDINFFRNRRGSHSQPRLTRQRKLRHLSDVDVGHISLNNQTSPSESSPVCRSLSSLDDCSARSSSAAPLPLPLPEIVLRAFAVSSSNSGDCPLPSPKEVPSREEPVDGDRGVSSTSAAWSRLSYQTIHKSTEHVDSRSAKSPTDHVRKALRDPIVVEDVQKNQNNFRMNFLANSAPTSGLSSPVLSPQRFITGDNLTFPYITSQGYQIRSAPELPPFDMLGGFSYRTSPEKTLSTPDRSPLHSPKAKNPFLNPKIPSGAVSPLHHKLSPESTTAWHESNGHVTVHPLPLPPGAATPSQSAFAHQTSSKPELSSMKSRWKKGKLIGRGTFGSVYVATNRETGALCAMKEVDLFPDDPKSAECIKQLEQEIKVLSQLKHPNIVEYYGSEIVDGHFYIYLEYVYPGSINKYVREHCGAMTESVVRNFTRHILSGLDYLHSTKTIHRDIKGANLLVDASGVVKLADFGMAKHLSGQAATLSLKGSPYWMAPEVLHAAMQNDTDCNMALAVDIWSLGCTVIEMLTEKPPWSEYEGPAAMFKVLRETPPIPETLSSEGKDFLQCCFRRNPAERPSASKLLEHRFLRNSHHAEVPACIQAFSAMNLDKTYSPKERSKYKIDSVHTSGTTTVKGKQQYNGEIGQQSHPETCDSTVASHHSPRSTLEALPSLSPPHPNGSTQNSIPFEDLWKRSPSPFTRNVLSCTQPVVGSSHLHALLEDSSERSPSPF